MVSEIMIQKADHAAAIMTRTSFVSYSARIKKEAIRDAFSAAIATPATKLNFPRFTNANNEVSRVSGAT